MALAAATLHEVAATGSDGNAGSDANGGGFNPTNANMPTDLAADTNTGNTSSPVVSSATYTFQAGDVGHWVFIKAGTNTTPGWFKISSVSAGKATLSAAIGASVLYNTGGPYGLNTAAGIATSATPTAMTFAVDYSQGGTPGASVTDAITAGTTTVTSASNPFHKAMVGNLIAISGGTGSLVQAVYEIVSDTGIGTIVVDRTITTSTGATAKAGGCLASPGQSGANHIAGNHIYVKNATYTVTSASNNISAGCLSLAATAAASALTAAFGYNSLRTDAPKTTNRPTIVASGISTFTLIGTAAESAAFYFIVDGASLTSSRGVGIGAGSRAHYITAKNMTNSGFVAVMCTMCDATGCSTQPAFLSSTQTNTLNYCVAWNNTVTGFNVTITTAMNNCLSVNNSGATSDGFAITNATLSVANCTSYGNGRDGFRIQTNAGAYVNIMNSIGYGNTGTNFNAIASYDTVYLINTAAGNGAANWSTNISLDGQIGNIILTGDPFINAAGGNFGLNSNAGGGALLRAAGVIGAFPGISATTYQDVGGVQHQDSSAGGGGTPILQSGILQGLGAI